MRPTEHDGLVKDIIVQWRDPLLRMRLQVQYMQLKIAL